MPYFAYKMWQLQNCHIMKQIMAIFYNRHIKIVIFTLICCSGSPIQKYKKRRRRKKWYGYIKKKKKENQKVKNKKSNKYWMKHYSKILVLENPHNTFLGLYYHLLPNSKPWSRYKPNKVHTDEKMVVIFGRF